MRIQPFSLWPFFLLAFQLFSVSAFSLDRITATVTVTNASANNNTFVINGDTRTWKTQPVATPSTQIGVTNSIGAVATNLFNHLAAYPHAGSLLLSRSGTNGITLTTLLSGSMAASLTGTWGYITLSTQSVPVLQAVRVPFSSMPLPASDRTNQASYLAAALSLYSTGSVASGSVFGSNFVDKASNQTNIAGAKAYDGTNYFAQIYGSPIVNSPITGTSTFSGVSVYASDYIQVADGNFFSWVSRGKLKMDSDGVLVLYNDAQTGFTKLAFGGMSSAFPCFIRNSTALNLKLADGSADAPLTVGNLTIGGGTAITKVMSASATLNFGNTLTATSGDLTITVTGAADGDPVTIGVPAGSVDANSCFTAWVSSANTVTVRFNNYSAGSINPASGTFRATVTHF
jgi:hypothetical protein